jgi:hypothetical protein
MKNQTILSASICAMLLLGSGTAIAQLHTSFQRAARTMPNTFNSASGSLNVNRTLSNYDPIKASAPQTRISNKLEPDKYAHGDHTAFKRNVNNDVYKYDTYQMRKNVDKTHFNSVKRFDGGTANGGQGAVHVNKKTFKPIPTPHVQGKNVYGGVRTPLKFEIPKGIKKNY